MSELKFKRVNGVLTYEEINIKAFVPVNSRSIDCVCAGLGWRQGEDVHYYGPWMLDIACWREQRSILSVFQQCNADVWEECGDKLLEDGSPPPLTWQVAEKQNAEVSEKYGLHSQQDEVFYVPTVRHSLIALLTPSECSLNAIEVNLSKKDEWRLRAPDKLERNQTEGRTNERTKISISWSPVGAKII